MLRVVDSNGGFREAQNRVGSADYWQIYHRARKKRPDLVEAMYSTIQDIVNSEQFMDSNQRFPKSSWLGSKILKDWSQKSEWEDYCGDLAVSGSLFGQIMWTVMFDHKKTWCTTTTPNTNSNREDRVYWLTE
jgi:hypothetical protein